MNERGASECVMFNNRDVTISLCKACENIQTTTTIMFSYGIVVLLTVVRWLEKLILMFSCSWIYLAQIKLVHVCWDMSDRVSPCVTVWARPITSSWVSGWLHAHTSFKFIKDLFLIQTCLLQYNNLFNSFLCVKVYFQDN